MTTGLPVRPAAAPPRGAPTQPSAAARPTGVRPRVRRGASSSPAGAHLPAPAPPMGVAQHRPPGLPAVCHIPFVSLATPWPAPRSPSTTPCTPRNGAEACALNGLPSCLKRRSSTTLRPHAPSGLAGIDDRAATAEREASCSGACALSAAAAPRRCRSADPSTPPLPTDLSSAGLHLAPHCPPSLRRTASPSRMPAASPSTGPTPRMTWSSRAKRVSGASSCPTTSRPTRARRGRQCQSAPPRPRELIPRLAQLPPHSPLTPSATRTSRSSAAFCARARELSPPDLPCPRPPFSSRVTSPPWQLGPHSPHAFHAGSACRGRARPPTPKRRSATPCRPAREADQQPLETSLSPLFKLLSICATTLDPGVAAPPPPWHPPLFSKHLTACRRPAPYEPKALSPLGPSETGIVPQMPAGLSSAGDAGAPAPSPIMGTTQPPVAVFGALLPPVLPLV